MKNSPSRLPSVLNALFSLAVVVPLVAAETQDQRQSDAYRASVAQDTLKKDIAAIQSDLAQLRDEMRQLLPDDVKLVDRAFEQLESLSRNEMDRAVASLRDASRSGDLQAQLGKLAGAFKDQSTIGSSLKRMAVDLNARQSVATIGPKITELLLRQSAVTNELGRLSQIDQNPSNLRDQFGRRFAVASGDQDGVTEDVKILVKQVDDLAQNLSDESQKTMLKLSVIARDQQLAGTADSAMKLTHDGPFKQAIASQQQAVKTLVLMKQALASDVKTEERVRNLSEAVAKLLEEQKEVTAVVLEVGIKRPVPDEKKRLQSSVNDQVTALQSEVLAVNIRAAGNLDESHVAMTKAMANYDRMYEERDMARENSQTAVVQLEAAKKALDEQLASTTTPETAEQLAAALEALRREIAQAAMDQARANQTPPGATAPAPMTPEQLQAMQDRVENLQQMALPISPAASDMLAQASGQMAQADAASQQAAAQNLAEAAQSVAQQQAALAGQTPAQQALARAESQVAQTAQAVQQAQANLQSPQTSAQATNQAAAARQQAAAAQAAAAQAGAPPEAAQALAQAAQALGAAQMDAAQVRLPQAQSGASGAQQALAQAQQAMAQARAAIAQQAGSSLGSSPSKSGGAPGQNGGSGGGGGASNDHLTGSGPGVSGSKQVVTGLEPRDRDAVAQFQSEKVPGEFVPQVRQYYKNLADGVGL